MTALIVMLIAAGACTATMTGGLLSLKLAGKLPLVLGFSAGAVIGVAFFDLAPEALEAGKGLYEPRALLAIAALGFFLYTVLDRLVARHDCEGQANPARGLIGAASFSAHSVLDGFAMGIAFQASREIGLIVAAAVLAHDFADGLNTVNVVKEWRHAGFALRWLAVPPSCGGAQRVSATPDGRVAQVGCSALSSLSAPAFASHLSAPSHYGCDFAGRRLPLIPGRLAGGSYLISAGSAGESEQLSTPVGLAALQLSVGAADMG